MPISNYIIQIITRTIFNINSFNSSLLSIFIFYTDIHQKNVDNIYHFHEKQV